MARPVEQLQQDGIAWWRYSPENGSSLSPLVILHGLFGSADNWNFYGKTLSHSRTVLIPDVPNHGISRHIDGMDYREVARILLDSLGHLGFGTGEAPVTFLGHSMGGKIAMAIAFDQPSAVESLIIADIAPVTYPRRHDEIFFAMRSVADADVRSRSEADRVMAETIPDKGVRMFLLKSLTTGRKDPETDLGAERYSWRLNIEELESAYDDIRGWPFDDERYDGPVLAIAGELSPYIDHNGRERLGHHFPSVRIETIPGAGHWLHAEKREEFLALLEGELE